MLGGVRLLYPGLARPIIARVAAAASRVGRSVALPFVISKRVSPVFFCALPLPSGRASRTFSRQVHLFVLAAIAATVATSDPAPVLVHHESAASAASAPVLMHHHCAASAAAAAAAVRTATE